MKGQYHLFAREAEATQLPSLPMDLPVMASPGRSGDAPEGRSRPVQAEPTLITVDATALLIDDRFGLDMAALAMRYAAEIAVARERLANEQQQTAYPSVLASGKGRYTAFSAIPIVIASLDLARASNTPIRVSVLLCPALDGAALLGEMFAKVRDKSLFEKARYIAGCEAKYGTRRAWMRAEGIPHEIWEPRISKIAKIGRLDAWLLSKIDPHSISNAEVASRIVDAWRDPAKRRIITDLTEEAASAAKGPVKAGPLFRRIDAALHPTGAALIAAPWFEGQRNLLAADGTCVARLKRDDTGWSIGGSDIAALTRATLAAALTAMKD